MSASSAPPANTNLDSNNNNNNSNSNSNSNNSDIGNSNSKTKTMKQFKEDDAALEREQKVIEEQIKSGESSVIDALADTACNLLVQGRARDSLLLYSQSLEKMTNTRGEDHPDTLRMMHNKAVALGQLNRHEESLALFQKALKKKVIVLGENASLTLKTMANVATQLCYLERHDESIDLHEKVFEKRSRIQGDEHPDTLKTLYNLAIIQYNVGRDDDARQNASRCQFLARKIGDEETAARCTTLLSSLDVRKKYNEVTSDEKRRLLAKIIFRRKQTWDKAEVARLKAATAQPPAKEKSVDDLMAQWGFDDDNGSGKKKSSNATSDEGGSKQRKKKGKGNK
jgi:tetratricopeptide (TPR) repeat protein